MRKSILLLASLLISIFAFELAAQLFAPQELISLNRTDLWRPDEVFGSRQREHVRIVINTGEGDVLFITDENGHRIGDGSHRTVPVGRAREVLALGDSFLSALSMKYEDTLSASLERRLSANSEEIVSVENAGVGGWNPNHYYLEASRMLKERQYDLGIVFLYVGNDIISDRVGDYDPRNIQNRHAFSLPRSLKRRDWINGVFYPINDLLETRSHGFNLLKLRLWPLLARVGLVAAYFPDSFLRTQIDDPRWEGTVSICLDIEKEFAKHGSPVLFVLVPTPYQVNLDVAEKHLSAFGISPESVDLDQPNKILGRLFHQRGLRLIDPLEAMREQTAEGRQLYGKVDMHLSPDGVDVIVNEIAPTVSALLGQPYAPRPSKQLAADKKRAGGVSFP